MGSRASNRWAVLAAYACVAGVSQTLWLNFAPILSSIQQLYGVSESVASLLLLVFPLTFVLLSVHAGALTDRRGYRFSIGLGAVLMAVFACVRVFTGNFWVLLAAQTGISLGQPYAVNGITKLVLDQFPAEQLALATGLGTVGLFVGMALGLAATPPIFAAWGLSSTMAVFAAGAVISAVTFLAVCPKPTEGATSRQEPTPWATLFGSRNLNLLYAISFIGLGYFNGLTSWIEAILFGSGIHSEQAGIIGGTLIFGGIAGSAIIPALSERLQRRKAFLLLSIVLAAATLVPLCRSRSYSALLVWGFLQGFFFLPAYALLLDLTAREVGEKLSGAATGVLMLTGNAGGVIVILVMGWLKGESPAFPSALAFLLALLVVAGAGSFLTREAAAERRAG